MMIASSIDSMMSECMNRPVRRNTSTLHVDGWSFHDSLEALTQCSAQHGLTSPRSLLALSCQFWVCWRVGPRTVSILTLQALTRCTLASQLCISYIGPDAGTSLWTIDALADQRMPAPLAPPIIRLTHYAKVEFHSLPRSSSHRLTFFGSSSSLQVLSANGVDAHVLFLTRVSIHLLVSCPAS